MINLIKNLFKKKKVEYKFFDKNNNEIQYKEYLENEEAIIIENEKGLEKLPINGLRKEEVK